MHTVGPTHGLTVRPVYSRYFSAVESKLKH